MRDDLDRAAAVIAPPFPVEDRPVDLAGRHIGVFVKAFIDEALVMTEIEVGFRTVVCDEHLSVLDRIHRARVNVDIRVKFLHGYFVTSGFQKPSERCGSNSLPSPETTPPVTKTYLTDMFSSCRCSWQHGARLLVNLRIINPSGPEVYTFF